MTHTDAPISPLSMKLRLNSSPTRRNAVSIVPLISTSATSA